jgi:adenylate kinase
MAVIPPRELFFVGGIHGVGKSSLCSKVASEFNLQHAIAGDLIRRHHEIAATVDKCVADVGKNQDALVNAIQAMPVQDTPVLLDGHFCVLDSAEEIIRIPIQTFKQLSPIAALVVYDDVERIQERLQNRDGRSYSTGKLAALQNAELAHAREVCFAIGVELLTLSFSMLPKATQFIAHKLASRHL